MSGDTADVRIWQGADVSCAAVGSTAPTNVATALDAAFDVLGLLSEDGITEARTEEQTDHFAYGSILVRTTRRKHVRTFKVVALENSLLVAQLADPNSTATTASGVTKLVVSPPSAVTNTKAWVIEKTDGALIERIYVPKGEVVSVGDVLTSDNEMAKKELTIKVYGSTYSSVDGVLYVKFTNDTAMAA